MRRRLVRSNGRLADVNSELSAVGTFVDTCQDLFDEFPDVYGSFLANVQTNLRSNSINLAAYKAAYDIALTEFTPTNHACQLFDEMLKIFGRTPFRSISSLLSASRDALVASGFFSVSARALRRRSPQDRSAELAPHHRCYILQVVTERKRNGVVVMDAVAHQPPPQLARAPAHEGRLQTPQELRLRYDDLYDPYYDLDIKEALARLPREVVDARNQRLKRAMDLSMKHEYLPRISRASLQVEPEIIAVISISWSDPL
uniref:Uncharacterized protein n=1 Tax=Ananas comosus var. bracteatus TaxID=296719 RepID=A0A6V7NJ66_ANACO|nr:unnamed protein product [Ananas comosus var. bracteatus]